MAAPAAPELSIWASLGHTAPGGELIEAMVADNAECRIATEPSFAHLPNRNAESRLCDITTPSLVIHGEHDHPEIASTSERLVADMSDARGVVIPGADHNLPLRKPERLAELLLSHLA